MTDRRVLVIVNGVPGAGKTTLASIISARTGLPHISKDRIKLELAARPGSSADLSARADAALWDALAAAPGGAIVETWFGPTGPDGVRAGAERAGLPTHRMLEIWCDVPVDVARSRCDARLDSPGRPAALDTSGRDDAFWKGLADAAPLALGPVLRIDTSNPVDTVTLTSAVHAIEQVRGSGPED